VFIKLSRDRSVSDPEAEVLSVLSFSSRPFPNSTLSASFQLRNHDIEQAISILDIIPRFLCYYVDFLGSTSAKIIC